MLLLLVVEGNITSTDFEGNNTASFDSLHIFIHYFISHSLSPATHFLSNFPVTLHWIHESSFIMCRFYDPMIELEKTDLRTLVNSQLMCSECLQ